MARIINTSKSQPTDTLGRLAFYSGMDNLTLFEINDGLDDLLTPTKRITYEMEMDLQTPLLEMSLNGVFVDQGERDRLVRVTEQELQIVNEHLHRYCEAIGYYEYYLEQTCIRFSRATGIPSETLPRSWDEWKDRPLHWRRAAKQANPLACAEYHKGIKSFGPPYVPGDREAWRKKQNGCFNGNSSAQKLRLFYDFFGHRDNTISEQLSPDFHPPWNKTRGITEYKTRDHKGEYTPSTDRESLEKIENRGLDLDVRDAAFWSLPFLKCCLEISDLAKALGFLRCKLEKGYLKSSFGSTTKTGRLASKENAQGFGWNAQNIDPTFRIILSSEPGWKLGANDYGQIESRIVGAICYRLFGATAYLNATECGDLHTLVCSMVWEDLPWPSDFNLFWLAKHGPFPSDMVRAAKGIAREEFYRGKSRRDLSKTLGHGSNYQGQPRHMAKQAHIELGLVEHYQDTYFTVFPELRKWHQWVAKQVQTKGEITTMLGRCRRFFGRPNDAATIREAVAYEPQSVAADYTNSALIEIYKAQAAGLPIKLFLQKHDEIGFRFREADEDLIMPPIRAIMERHIPITNPSGEERDWFVPVEEMTGWNLGHASESNPDGLKEFFGHDPRTRQRAPKSILERRI